MEGITLGHHIFLKNPNDALTLAHELVHVAQQERDGWFLFYLRYLFVLPMFWNKYRMEYEAEAYAVYARQGISMDWVGSSISGWLYGWCCRKSQAISAVKKYM